MTTATEKTFAVGDIVTKTFAIKGQAIYRVIGHSDIFGMPAVWVVRVRRHDLKTSIMVGSHGRKEMLVAEIEKWGPK